MMISPIKRYSKEELPVTLKLTVIEIPAETSGAGLFLMVIGGIIAVVSVGFIIFGPSTIYYNRYEGMSLIHFLQAYPGPLATLGFLILVGGQKMQSGEIEKEAKTIKNQLISESAKYLSFTAESLTENQSLYFHHINDSSYEVGIQERECYTRD